MRLALITPTSRGHLHPLAAVARPLIAAGHEVGWIALPEMTSAVHAVGGVEIPISRPAPGPAQAHDGPELARVVADPEALSAWIGALLLEPVEALIDPLREGLRAFAPDAVALDPMVYAAAIACAAEGLPWLGVSSSLNPVTDEAACADVPLIQTLRRLSPARAALFARHGWPEARFSVADVCSPHGTTVYATEAWTGSAPAGVHLVGPTCAGPRGDDALIAGFPWGGLGDAPLAYVSFGSQITWQPEAFVTLAHGAVEAGLKPVIAAGRLAHEPHFLARLPDEAVCVPYAPQRALLARARVCVTHCGANTVMETLRAGVPMLAAPWCNDQLIQARIIQARGVGCMVDPRMLRPEVSQVTRVARLMTELSRADAPQRQALRPITATYVEADGGAEAARLLLELAR